MKIQQGDVIIKKVLNIPSGMKKLPHLILALGEHTGNSHTVTVGDAELYDDGGVLYLRVTSEEATVIHQEHDAVTLPRGDYRISQVREMDWVKEETRNVKD